MGSTKNEIFKLKTQLAAVSTERNILHDTLRTLQIRVMEENKCNIQNQNQKQNYESHITELHYVIAELKRQLNVQQQTIIREEAGESETDDDGNEEADEFQFSSFTSSQSVISENEDKKEDEEKEVCYDGGEISSNGDPFLKLPHSEGNKPYSCSQFIKTEKQVKTKSSHPTRNNLKDENELLQVCYIQESDENLLAEVNGIETNDGNSITPDKKCGKSSNEKSGFEKQRKQIKITNQSTKLQFSSICNEVAEIRREHGAIRQSLYKREGELEVTKNELQNIGKERDFLRKKVTELESLLKHSPKVFPMASVNHSCNADRNSNQSESAFHSSPSENYDVSFKIAERIQLTSYRNHYRQNKKPNRNNSTTHELSPTTQNNILNNNYAKETGIETMPTTTTEQVSKVVHFTFNSCENPDVVIGDDSEELISTVTPATSKLIEHILQPIQIESGVREFLTSLSTQHVESHSTLIDEKLREWEIQREKILGRCENLQSQNDLLQINLQCARDRADVLTESLTEHESNNMALQILLQYSDQAIEAYDVLVALLESELGQVLASCHAAGFGSTKSFTKYNTQNKNGPTHCQQELQGLQNFNEMENLLQRAYENRLIADIAAERLLQKLVNNDAEEAVYCDSYVTVMNSPKNLSSPSGMHNSMSSQTMR